MGGIIGIIGREGPKLLLGLEKKGRAYYYWFGLITILGEGWRHILKIEDVKDDYMVISSWFGGKKINTLRYYYSLDKAKEYLGENSSNKLVNALGRIKSFDRGLNRPFIRGRMGIF